MPSNESNPPIQPSDEDVKKGRAFEPLPKEICHFKSAVINRRLTTIYLSHPVKPGAQACVYEQRINNRRRFIDGIIVFPATINVTLMEYDVAIGAALAVSATIHKAELQSPFVEERLKELSARTKSERKKATLIKRISEDLDQLNGRVKGTAYLVIQRIHADVTDLMVAEALSKWTPVLLSKNGIRNREDLHEQWQIINNWDQLKHKTWSEIWRALHPNYKKGFKDLDSDATTLASNNRKGSIEKLVKDGAHNLERRCSKFGLKAKAEKSMTK